MGLSPSLMQRVLRGIIPPRVFGPRFIALLDAIAGAIQTLYDYIAATIRESNPGTATETLRDWYTSLGLSYDPTLGLHTRRSLARQGYISIGGQSQLQLQDTLQIAFPDISIERVEFDVEQMVGVGMVGRLMTQDYPPWFGGVEDGTYPYAYYRVTGSLNDQQELTALLNLIDRIAPAEMEAVTGEIVVRNLTETSEVGLAMVGLAQVGRTKEDA